ncbi:MAG: LodA/GoxA family CTQ-dependent oxidase [Myxococcales bacterium]|nr:LodA/GoxA family CTQ-dependent oxidase [Myxococcales bacterium]
MVNSKAASPTTSPNSLNDAPRNPTVTGPARAGLVIDPGPRTLAGPNERALFDHGKFTYPGFPTVDVSLGGMHTDDEGRLVVAAAAGNSASPDPDAPIEGFYDNPRWYDDVADGPVTATVTIQGRRFEVEGAGVSIFMTDVENGGARSWNEWWHDTLTSERFRGGTPVGRCFSRRATSQWMLPPTSAVGPRSVTLPWPEIRCRRRACSPRWPARRPVPPPCTSRSTAKRARSSATPRRYTRRPPSTWRPGPRSTVEGADSPTLRSGGAAASRIRSDDAPRPPRWTRAQPALRCRRRRGPPPRPRRTPARPRAAALARGLLRGRACNPRPRSSATS